MNKLSKLFHIIAQILVLVYFLLVITYLSKEI